MSKNPRTPRIYYTDYPVKGNEAHVVVPIEVLSYDRDKYAYVRYKGELDYIKAGYIRQDPELKKRISAVELYSLPREWGDSARTRLQAVTELRKLSRGYVEYRVDMWPVGESKRSYSRTFRSQAEALSAVLALIQRGVKGQLVTFGSCVYRRWSSTSEPLFDIEDGVYSDYRSRTRSRRDSGNLAKKHFRKIKIALTAAEKAHARKER